MNCKQAVLPKCLKALCSFKKFGNSFWDLEHVMIYLNRPLYSRSIPLRWITHKWSKISNVKDRNILEFTLNAYPMWQNRAIKVPRSEVRWVWTPVLKPPIVMWLWAGHLGFPTLGNLISKMGTIPVTRISGNCWDI